MRYLFVFALAAGSVCAKEKCSAELKIRLIVTDAPMAAAALKDKKPKSGQVVLYDTADLKVFKKDIILRVRSGSDQDLTVKARPQGPEHQLKDSDLPPKVECEIDVGETKRQQSFSVKSDHTGNAPKTGSKFAKAMTPDQVKLLEVLKVKVPWKNVDSLPAVSVTEWSSKDIAGFTKLSLERWSWPGHDILELSTKTDPADIDSTLKKLKAWVKTNHLTADPDQRGKVTTFLSTVQAAHN